MLQSKHPDVSTGMYQVKLSCRYAILTKAAAYRDTECSLILSRGKKGLNSFSHSGHPFTKIGIIHYKSVDRTNFH